MENGTKQQPLVVKIKVPCLNFQRILPYELHHSILDIKQILLENLCQPLDEALNYGLYLPPGNGYIGGFLNEQIRVIQCNFNDTSPALELRYKRRVYRDPKTNIKNLKEINSVPKQKRFLAHVHKGHVAKVKSMCDKGIDPNFHETLTGDTPLIIATKILDPSDLIETLVKGGAHIDFRAKTTQSLSPLHVAAQMNKAIAVKKLLELGAFPNVKDATGLTPLHHLLSNQGDPLCAKLLLENDKGYTLEVVSDQMGWQEIHYVCRYGQPKILDMLIANGADINSPNKDGETPLHIAAIHNQNDCVCLLLNKGANPLIANLAGRTPSQTATEYGNHELATFIANYSMRLSHNPSSIINHHQNSFKTSPYVRESNSDFPFLNAATTSTKHLNNNNSSQMSNAKFDDTFYENSPTNASYNNNIINNLINYNPITPGNDNIQLNNLNMNYGSLHISTNRIIDNESETFKTFRNIGSDELSIPANTNNLDSPLLSLLSTEDKNSSSVTSGKGSSLNSDDLNQQSSLEEICNAIRLDTDDTDGYSVNPNQNFNSSIAKNLTAPLLNSLVQNKNKSVCKQSDQHNQEGYTMIATTSVGSPTTACKVSFNPNPNHPPPPENIVARLFDRAAKETDPISETVKTTQYADNTSGSGTNPEVPRPKTFSPSPSITHRNNDGLISYQNSQLSLINDKERSDKTNNFMATRHNLDCLSKSNLDLSGKYISQSSNIMLKPIASDLAQRVVFLHRGIKGYGFILTGPKNIPQTLSEQSPHVILRVELNSPAHQADLKEGDHIIEVNGVHIQFLSHGQVSKLIAQSGSEKPLTMTVLTQRRPPSNNTHLANEINKDRTYRNNMSYLSLSNNQYHYSPTHTLNKNKNDKNDLHYVANRFGTFNGKSAHKISLSPLYNNGNDDWKMQTLPARMNKKFWGHEPPNKSSHLTNPLGVGFYNIPGTAPLIHQSIPSNLHMLHDGHTPVNHTFTNIPSELKYGSINSRLTRKFGSHYNSLISDNAHPQNLTFTNNSMMGLKPMNYETNEALHVSYVDLPSGIFNGKKNNKKENKNTSGLNSTTPFKFFSLGRSNSSKASAKYYKEFNKYVNGTGFNSGLTNFGPDLLSTSSLTSSKMPDRYKKRYNKSLLPTSWAFTLSESELTPDTLHHQQDSKICGNVQSRLSMDLSNDIYSIPENGQLSQKDLNKMENMVPNYNQNQQKVSLNSIKLMSSPSPVMQYVQAYPIFIEHHNQMTNPHNFLETQKALEDSIMAHNRNGISSNHIQLNSKSVAFDLNSNQIIQVNANKKPTKGQSLESNLISPQSYPIPPPFQAPKPHIILPDDQNCRNSIEQFSINPIMVGNSDELPMTGSLKILNQHLQQAQINKIHNKNQFLPTETNNEPSTLNERSGCEIKCNLLPHMEKPEENQKMTLRKCETDELKSKGVAVNNFGNKSPSLLEELVQSPLVQKLRDINIKSESIGMTDNENNTDETKLKSNKLKSSLTTTESECENDALIDNDHSVRNESNGSPLETEITEKAGTLNNYSNTSETNANQHSALLNEIHTFFQQKNNLTPKPTTNTTSTESDDKNLENLTTLNIQEKINLNESHINNNMETITCNLKQGECKKVQSDDSNLLQRKKIDPDPNAIYSIPKPSNKRQNQSKETDTSEPLTNGANNKDDHFDINVKKNDKIDLNNFDSESISKVTTQENCNHPLETLGKSCVNGIKRRHLFKPSLKFSRSSKPQRLTKHVNPPNIEVNEVNKKGKCNPKKQNIPNSKAFKDDIHPRYINATRSLQRLSCPDFNVIAQCPAMMENQNFQGEYNNASGVEKRIPKTAPQNNCNGPNVKSNSLVSRKAIVDRNRFSLAFNTPSNFNSKGNKIQPPFAHILSTPAAFIQNDPNLTTAIPINNQHFVNNQMPYDALYSNYNDVENNLLSHNYPAAKYKIKGKIDKNYKVYP